MASVAMNVITGAQNNNTVFKATSQPVNCPPPPRLLQISGDRERH